MDCRVVMNKLVIDHRKTIAKAWSIFADICRIVSSYVYLWQGAYRHMDYSQGWEMAYGNFFELIFLADMYFNFV